MPTQRSPYAFEIWRPLPYSVETAGLSERIADISHLCIRRNFSMRRNRAEELTLELNLRAAEEYAVTKFGPNGFGYLFDEGKSEIRVRRGNVYLFGVQIALSTQTIKAGSETFQLIGMGWLDWLASRFLRPSHQLVYTNQPLHQIVLGVIGDTQQGEQGNILFRNGEYATDRLASATYQPYGPTVKEIIQEITGWEDSIDIRIDHERRIFTYYPQQGTDKTHLHFWLGEGGNIVDVAQSTDATQIVNDSINRGSGNGLDVQTIQSPEDPASRAYYGQRSRIDDYPATSDGDEARLEAAGKEVIRVYNRPIAIPEVVIDGSKAPPLGAYGVGDWVRFDIQNRPSFRRASNRAWRINEISVDINENDYEEIRLSVGNS